MKKEIPLIITFLLTPVAEENIRHELFIPEDE